MDLGYHVLAIHDDRCAARGPQGDMQDGTVFRNVDRVSPEHGVDAFAQAGLLREAAEERDGLFRDAILRVIEINANRFRRQTFAACCVIGEEPAEMQPSDLLVVGLERFPCRARSEVQYARHRLRHPSSFHCFSVCAPVP